jgi:hypothetical protein
MGPQQIGEFLDDLHKLGADELSPIRVVSGLSFQSIDEPCSVLSKFSTTHIYLRRIQIRVWGRVGFVGRKLEGTVPSRVIVFSHLTIEAIELVSSLARSRKRQWSCVHILNGGFGIAQVFPLVAVE